MHTIFLSQNQKEEATFRPRIILKLICSKYGVINVAQDRLVNKKMRLQVL
jgi:hypothetical protein